MQDEYVQNNHCTEVSIQTRCPYGNEEPNFHLRFKGDSFCSILQQSTDVRFVCSPLIITIGLLRRRGEQNSSSVNA